MTDSIDKAAGLLSKDAVYESRRFRPEFVMGAELCRESVLMPNANLGINSATRVAIAQRIAALNGDDTLATQYSEHLEALQPTHDLLAVAGGATTLPEPLASIVRHVDLVTMTPIMADRHDIERLIQAGLDNPQIVALSELIAFVNFQTRVVAGLRLLRSA